jgi:hypothetical protein
LSSVARPTRNWRLALFLTSGLVVVGAALALPLVAGVLAPFDVAVVGAGATIGVRTTPVTLPFTALRCFDPITFRFARVAARFAAAAAFCSTVKGVRAFFGARPKSASTSADVPKAAITHDTNASMKTRRAGAAARSAASFALSVARAVSTSANCCTIA